MTTSMVTIIRLKRLKKTECVAGHAGRVGHIIIFDSFFENNVNNIFLNLFLSLSLSFFHPLSLFLFLTHTFF